MQSLSRPQSLIFFLLLLPYVFNIVQKRNDVKIKIHNANEIA